MNLIKGSLPKQMEISQNIHQDITQKIQEAIDLAIALHLQNQHKIPPQHEPKKNQILKNLFMFQTHLKESLYLYNSSKTITSPEDYLLGFTWFKSAPHSNSSKYLGKDPVIIRRLYDQSIRLLAQDIYHDCIPEHLKIISSGVLEEVDSTSHKTNYQEIQTAIFNEYDENGIIMKDEVKELGNFYRNIIDEVLFREHPDVENTINKLFDIKIDKPTLLQKALQHVMDKTLLSLSALIVSGEKYITSESNSAEFNQELTFLSQTVQNKNSSCIEKALAYSALYLRDTNGSRESAVTFFKNTKNSFVKEISQELFNNPDKSLSLILHTFHATMLDKSYKNHFKFLNVVEKQKISKNIDQSILAIWGNIDETNPFSPKTQNELKDILELHKFRTGHALVIPNTIAYPICFAKLFYEADFKYVINFIKKTSSLQNKGAQLAEFRDHMLNDFNFLKLYTISIFMDPHYLDTAQKKNKKIFDVAIKDLYGYAPKIPSIISNDNGQKLLTFAALNLAQFIVFYIKNSEIRKALKIVNIMVKIGTHDTELTPSENALQIFANLKKHKQDIIDHITTYFQLKSYLSVLSDAPDFIIHHKPLQEIINQLDSHDTRTQLDGYNNLLQLIRKNNLLQKLSNYSKNKSLHNKPILELICEEVHQIFETIYMEHDQVNPDKTTETNLGLCALLLAHVANFYIEHNIYPDKTNVIIDMLKEKLNTYYNEGILMAILVILYAKKEYNEVEFFINRLHDPYAKAHELQNLAKTYLNQGQIQKARRILEQNNRDVVIQIEKNSHDGLTKRLYIMLQSQISSMLQHTKEIDDLTEKSSPDNLEQMLRTQKTVKAKEPLESSFRYRAKLLKHNLIEWRNKHPEETLLFAFDSDLGEMQKKELMPLWKIVDGLKNMTDYNGNLLFPEDKFVVLRRTGSTGRLSQEINVLIETQKVFKHNIFLVGKHSNIIHGRFDSLKGLSWITAIDDDLTNNEISLPIFEALTLTIMSAFNVDNETLQRFYSRISDTPLTPEEILTWQAEKIMYILPKMIKRNPQELQKLYELEADVY
ncbi:MAG: hypothetical protein KJ983_02695, partial [Candidatus Omnitrophica bacterium]|nr:hypothetical protein [Candidatus Omnitrophota bacterium]